MEWRFDRPHVGCVLSAVTGILAMWKGVFGNFDQFNHPLALRYCPIWVYRPSCIVPGVLLLAVAAWFLS